VTNRALAGAPEALRADQERKRISTGSAPRRRRVLAALAVAVTLAAAGCGGGGSSPSASGSSDYQQEVAFAHCMRSHNVPDWPDPQPQGGFPRTGTDQSSPQFRSAFKACQHLLPPNQPLNATAQHQAMAQALQFSKCMRSHGFPNFPDPSALPGGGVFFGPSASFDPNSPLAQAANKACHGGLSQGAPQGG
jgi:hypothetical protein